MQMQGSQQTAPITDVKIVTQRDRCPTGYFILERTVQGYDGQLFDSTWRHKGKRYLCFTRQAADRVIEDLTIISEDDTVLPGFSALNKAHDDDDKALRKHVLCLRIKSQQTATSAVCDIVLINRTKGEQAPPGFNLIANDVNDLSICYKLTPLTSQQLPPSTGHPFMYSSAPHPLGPDRQQWSSQSAGPGPPAPWQQQQAYQAAPYQAPYSPHHPTIPVKPAASSAIEGLPFQLNPKFEIMWKKSGPALPNMQNLSVDDVTSKYAYDFSTERAVTSR